MKTIVVSTRIPLTQLAQAVDGYERLLPGQTPASISALVQTTFMAGLSQLLGPSWPDGHHTDRALAVIEQLRGGSASTAAATLLERLTTDAPAPAPAITYPVPTTLDDATTKMVNRLLPTLTSGQLTPMDQLTCGDSTTQEVMATWVLATPESFAPEEVLEAKRILAKEAPNAQD